MRQYINIIAQYIAEAIINELDQVPAENSSKEIGSAGKPISASMTDMLPHHGVSERNKPQAYADIFARAAVRNTSYEREPAPLPDTIKRRRNNDAGVKHLRSVPKGGDATALLHSDFAGTRPRTTSIVPRKVR